MTTSFLPSQTADEQLTRVFNDYTYCLEKLDHQFEDIKDECIICLETKENAIIRPCGHKLCWSCAITLLTHKEFAAYGRCPYCRDSFWEASENRPRCPPSRFPVVCCKCFKDLSSPLTTKYNLLGYSSNWLCRLTIPPLPCGHALCWDCCGEACGIRDLPRIGAADHQEFTLVLPRSSRFQCPECKVRVLRLSLIPEQLHRLVAAKKAKVNKYGFYEL